MGRNKKNSFLFLQIQNDRGDEHHGDEQAVRLQLLPEIVKALLEQMDLLATLNESRPPELQEMFKYREITLKVDESLVDKTRIAVVKNLPDDVFEMVAELGWHFLNKKNVPGELCKADHFYFVITEEQLSVSGWMWSRFSTYAITKDDLSQLV
jgi:hypothetical protein